MLPDLDPEGGLTLALARGLSVAALLSVFGTLAFRTAVGPRVFPRMPAATVVAVKAGLLRLARLGLGAQLLATLAWLALQSDDMAGASSVRDALSAIPAVLSGTMFGHLVALQLAAIPAVALALGRRDRRQRAACGLAGLATVLEAGHSHAAAMSPRSWLLLGSDILHLLAAGAWLGGLAPLLLVVALAAPRDAAAAARWFSPLGKLCLVVIAATALVQGWVLVASVPGLVGTGYGWMALVKAALFGVLFAFAAANRYRLAPALLRGDPARARRALVRSIGVQTAFGGAVVVAAAVLSGLPPAMHAQPVWPFPVRLSLDAVSEDPDLRNEAIGAGVALACAAALLPLALLVRRRGRWLVAVAAAAIAWFAVPHLDLLLVPAYPTSFQQSPTGFAASTIVEGAALYPGQCASCHGAEGHGDGAAAQGLPVPPADLTAAHLWMHADGEMFWWLSHGIEAPQGGMAMPGFARTLTPEQRWDLIDDVRARNAGLVVQAAGVWSPPLQAPGFQARCDGGRTRTLADLRGRFVRLVIGTAPPRPDLRRPDPPGLDPSRPDPPAPDSPAPDPPVTTVLATAEPTAHPGPGLCIADDAALPTAYGIVSGLAPPDLAGAQVLIDGEGWLRAVQPGRPGAGWNDTRRLAATIRQLQADPIARGAEDDHAHMRMR